MNNFKSIYSGLIAIIIICLLVAIVYISRSIDQENLNFKSITENLKNEIRDSKPNKTNLENVSENFNSGNFQQTNSILDAELEKDSRSVSLLLSKSLTLAQEASLTNKEIELGNQAREYVLKALQIDSANKVAFTLLGYTYEIQENYEKAYENYDLALNIDPNYFQAISQKGHAKQLQGNIKEAKKLYELAYQINKDFPLTNLGLGKIYTSENKFSEAKKLFLKVANSDTNNRQRAEGFYSAALITESLDSENLDEFSKLINQAIIIDPLYPQAYVAQAKFLFKSAALKKTTAEKISQIEESFEILDKALELNPKLAFAHLQLATQFLFLDETKNTKLILGNLPDIVKKDISLNKNEKEVFYNIIKNMQSKINTK